MYKVIGYDDMMVDFEYYFSSYAKAKEVEQYLNDHMCIAFITCNTLMVI